MEVIDIEAENKEILRRYRKLRRIANPYLKDGDAKLIKKAFNIAVDAHRDTRRKSGEPYIFHPLAVAQIVVDEINLGPTAIAAALLHDVVEDTDWTVEDIEREFGAKIASIVDGVTKIPSSKDFDLNSGVSQQAENFRKMILTLSDDVRVILIKLADRLHNMRTLDSMDRSKQLKIASETIFIYAPLAHRLGLYKIKSELEDLYLKYTQYETYREIAEKLEKNKIQRNKFIKEFIAPLEKSLESAGFKAKIFGRPKAIYSIWSKMQKQNIPFEKIYDLFAIRIIIDSIRENEKGENEKSDCWRVYSLVTDFYKPNPDRLRDWISTPRANGYESLHTTVMGSEGRWVEVQIRTKRMDEIAEKGYAAHWKYKEQGKNGSIYSKQKESGLDTWVRTIRELREHNDDLSAAEFISAFRENFFREEVFVFTPKGDLRKLPNGSTVLDFAFDIHSQVGLSCLGAKVNQKLVPLSYELRNGDQVEIITSKQAKPNADWLRSVTTTKAKTSIKDYIRDEKKHFITLGKELIDKKLKQFHLEINDQNLNHLKIFFSFKNLSDLYYNVGKGYITSKQINKFEKYKLAKSNGEATKNTKTDISEKATVKETVPVSKEANTSDTLIIGDNTKFLYNLAKCCNPIPGNDVFGFITINEGVKVHRTDCPNAVELLSNYGHRVIKAQWASQKEILFLINLEIIGNDRIGLVRDVTEVISSDMKVNISAIDVKITEQGIFEGNIKLFIRDNAHLETLIHKIRRIEGVQSVKRLDSSD